MLNLNKRVINKDKDWIFKKLCLLAEGDLQWTGTEALFTVAARLFKRPFSTVDLLRSFGIRIKHG